MGILGAAPSTTFAPWRKLYHAGAHIPLGSTLGLRSRLWAMRATREQTFAPNRRIPKAAHGEPNEPRRIVREAEAAGEQSPARGRPGDEQRPPPCAHRRARPPCVEQAARPARAAPGGALDHAIRARLRRHLLCRNDERRAQYSL